MMAGGADVHLRSGAQLLEYEAMARRIALEVRGRVLDLGCGFGQVTELLQRRGLCVTGFDNDPDYDGWRPLARYPHIVARFGSPP